MLFMLYFIIDKNEKQHYCKSRDHTDHVYKNIKQVTRPALNKQLMYLITYAIQKTEQERDTAPDPYSQRVTRQERKGKNAQCEEQKHMSRLTHVIFKQINKLSIISITAEQRYKRVNEAPDQSCASSR